MSSSKQDCATKGDPQRARVIPSIVEHLSGVNVLPTHMAGYYSASDELQLSVPYIIDALYVSQLQHPQSGLDVYCIAAMINSAARFVPKFVWADWRGEISLTTCCHLFDGYLMSSRLLSCTFCRQCQRQRMSQLWGECRYVRKFILRTEKAMIFKVVIALKILVIIPQMVSFDRTCPKPKLGELTVNETEVSAFP